MTASDAPLVTLALFAYNQSKYIQVAVESVLRQTYSPLEIILSDDRSTDDTFEQIKELAAAYTGPNRVIVRRSAQNVGTARHVQEAFDASNGSLFIVAAGDDVSLPDRVSALVAVWDRAGRPSGVVHSGWETFREDWTAPLRRFPPKRSKFSSNILEGYAHSQWLPAAAPTVGYTRDVFEKFPPLSGGSIIEDAPLFLRAALVGTFTPCNEILVSLRSHDDNSGTGYTVASPARWNRFIQSKLIAFRDMQADLVAWKGEINPTLRNQIERRILLVLRSLSGMLLPETGGIGRLERSRLFLRMISSPAISPNVRVRVEYALSFFGFYFHIHFKKCIRQRLLPANATRFRAR